MKRTIRRMISSIFVSVAVLVIAVTAVAYAEFAKTIPPEVLKQFDKDIVSGKRPSIGKLTQGDIFGLRNNPVFKEDFVRFTFDPTQLSTVQKDIFLKWLDRGYNRVLLQGNDLKTYAALSGVVSETIGGGLRRLQVNNRATACVDISDVSVTAWGLRIGRFRNSMSDFYGLRDGSRQDMISVLRYTDGIAAAGMFSVGNTKVYFLPANLGSADADRFRLNFWQWALGLPVPGSAETTVSGSSPLNLTEAAKYDSVILSNGDTITGTIQDESFKIKTSYAELTFGRDKIDKIEIEGAGANVDSITLRVGDKISGVLLSTKISIKLYGGQESEIAKDKIKTIRMRKAVAKDK